ncbi:MAG: S41 family peptidase [Pyrinomonadaceae bacterium]
MGKGKQLRIVSALCLLAALSFFPFPFPPSPNSVSARAERGEAAVVSTSTREGRLAVFDDTWSTINARYYDQQFNGLDWGAQRTVFRSLAAETNSGAELYAVLRRMIASLNDPHTRVFAPHEKSDWWRPRFVSIGLSVREVGGLPTVVHVDRDSAPRRAGIRAGDVMETINGELALSLVNGRLRNSLAPTTSARFRVFATLLEGPSETSVEIQWKGKKGNLRSGRFWRHWKQRELGLRIGREKGEYAVIEIDAFTEPIARSFTTLLREKVNSLRGVIIDLRGNGGGDAEAMAHIASTFLGEGISLGRFTDRSGTSFTVSTPSKSLLVAQSIPQSGFSHGLPLIVLTSERTSSAAEIFIGALKTSRRATIIGTETCGCVLAIRTRHLLPDGGLLDISELDYQTSEGDRLEGHGIKPDEAVMLQRSDLYSGRDRAMELAIGKLKALRNRTSPKR